MNFGVGKFWKILFFSIAFWNFSSARSHSLNGSTVYPNRFTSFTSRLTSSRKTPTCLDSLKNAAESQAKLSKHTNEVIELVTAASRQMQRRDWSSEFMSERIRLALQYDTQSEYISLFKGNAGFAATLGWTFAEYNRQTLPNFQERAIKSRHFAQILPEEECLDIRPLYRPVGKDGRGIIVELRTWSINKEILSQEERASAFAETVSASINSIFKKLKAYPDLYDEPILHLYADEVSLKLYGRLGFHKTHEEPILYPSTGEPWWDMAISPRNYERLVLKMNTPAFLMDFNQDIELVFGSNKIIVPQGSSFERHDMNSTSLGNLKFPGYNLIGPLSQTMEINWSNSSEQKLVAGKGAELGWFESGQLAFVSKLEEPITLKDQHGNPVNIDRDGSLHLNANGSIKSVVKLQSDTTLQEINAVVSKGGSISWDAAGKRLLSLGPLARPLILQPGLVAAKGAYLEWYPLAETALPWTITEVAGRTVLAEGVVAADGASVGWSPTWRIDDNKQRQFNGLRWSFISKLAEPLTLENGEIVPPGALIQFTDFTKPPRINQTYP